MSKRENTFFPYSSATGASERVNCAMKILPAYCGSHGKVWRAEQYAVRFFSLKKYGDHASADTVIRIMQCELKHVSLLGELIRKFGVNPVGINCSTRYEWFSRIGRNNITPKKILTDCIAEEINTVLYFEGLVKGIDDNNVKKVLRGIIDDDGLHVNELKKCLSKF